MCNKSDPLYKQVYLLAWKGVYKLIFHHQICVYRHNDNIKPKKAKSFSDTVVKTLLTEYSNKLDTFCVLYVIILTSISVTIYGIHVTNYLGFKNKWPSNLEKNILPYRDDAILKKRSICKASAWFELALQHPPCYFIVYGASKVSQIFFTCCSSCRLQ